MLIFFGDERGSHRTSATRWVWMGLDGLRHQCVTPAWNSFLWGFYLPESGRTYFYSGQWTNNSQLASTKVKRLMPVCSRSLFQHGLPTSSVTHSSLTAVISDPSAHVETSDLGHLRPSSGSSFRPWIQSPGGSGILEVSPAGLTSWFRGPHWNLKTTSGCKWTSMFGFHVNLPG